MAPRNSTKAAKAETQENDQAAAAAPAGDAAVSSPAPGGDSPASDPAAATPEAAATPAATSDLASQLAPEDRQWSGLDLAENAGLWAFYGQSCPAAVDVLKERCRQVNGEGYSTAHDDSYVGHELPAAAICYAIQASSLPAHRAVFSWPFAAESFKPTDRRTCLVKAGALILAEIERLDRAEAAAD